MFDFHVYKEFKYKTELKGAFNKLLRQYVFCHLYLASKETDSI